MFLRGRYSYSAQAQGQLLASGSLTVLLGPLDTSEMHACDVILHNLGPGTLSGVLFQQSDDVYGRQTGWPSYDGRPQSGPSQWNTIASRSPSSVAVGVQALGTVGPQRWVRVVVLSDQPGVTVSGYWFARS